MDTFLERIVMPRSRSRSLLSSISSPVDWLSRKRCPAKHFVYERGLAVRSSMGYDCYISDVLHCYFFLFQPAKLQIIGQSGVKFP